MQNHRDDIAPTLPNELLRSIFLEWFDSESTENGIPRPSCTSIPLCLTWVNSQWREVAVSTPQLWTSIALPTARARSTNPNPNPTPEDIELLKLYISRSGDVLPMSFLLDYGGAESEERPSGGLRGSEDTRIDEHVIGIHRLTAIMDDIRHRWRVVVLRCRIPRAFDVLISSLVIGAPSLEHLHLSTTPQVHRLPDGETDSDNSYAIRMLDLVRCPKLESIVLQCPQLHVNPFLPDDGPLTNLSFLGLNVSSSQPDAFTWLQSSPNLQTLFIHFVDAPPFALPFARPRLLPRLTRFCMSCFASPSDPSSFLQLLMLPSLKVFDLLMDGTQMDQGWPHVLELVRRSSPERGLFPPLEELSLLGTPMAASELLDLLPLLPGLRKLALDDVLTSNEVLHRLTALDTEQAINASNVDRDITNRAPLCPVLEWLVLHACAASLPVLANMVSSRCRRVSQAQDQGQPDDSTAVSNQLAHTEEPRYRTLKTLELVHSYRTLPPVVEDPLFARCLEQGLQIVQRPQSLSQDASTASS